MNREELAGALLAVATDERACVRLLHAHRTLADRKLAEIIKDRSLVSWSGDPQQVKHWAAVLRKLARFSNDCATAGLATWIAALASVIAGEMREALTLFGQAELELIDTGDPHAAASSQVGKLVALAMLGRYEEAISCGLRARDVLLEHGDLRAAGKVENNIGNIYNRRDQYRAAEDFQRSARQRFLLLDDQVQLAMIENSLANILTAQYRFSEAETLHVEARRRAASCGLVATQAEIEASMGTRRLLQGNYSDALDLLEQSRRRYAAHGMRHEAATVDQLLADAYIELNLVSEARAVSGRLVVEFGELGMQAETARAHTQHAAALVALGQTDEAHGQLASAHRLFIEEGNRVGAATAKLLEAQLCHRGDDAPATFAALADAERAFFEAGAWGRLLLARWLRAEALRSVANFVESRRLLDETLRDAEIHMQPQISWRCHSSRGLVALAAMHRQSDKSDASSTQTSITVSDDSYAEARSFAEAEFKQAVEIIETLRAPLAADEFRTAYFADKLTAYIELLRLCLTESPPRAEEALQIVERSRARALLDAIGGEIFSVGDINSPTTRVIDVESPLSINEFSVSRTMADAEEERMHARLIELRNELDRSYNLLNRTDESGTQPDEKNPVPSHADLLLNQIHALEAETGDIRRSLQSRRPRVGKVSAETDETLRPDWNAEQSYRKQDSGSRFDLASLQSQIGADTALIEYANLDDELLAFVVTQEGVRVVRELGSEQLLREQIGQFRFQIDALRHGAASRLQRHMDALSKRATRHLNEIYNAIFATLEPYLEHRTRVCVVPHQALHYVPFHALHDGARYLIERYEFVCAPSAGVLQLCLRRATQQRFSKLTKTHAVLCGVGDIRATNVRGEIEALSPLFRDARVLLDQDATVAAVMSASGEAHILHLACHGQFRPDNPRFSSLKLSDGYLNVHDAATLDLRRCRLVTLSACETGINAIAPGEELIGLMRGFFAAGASSLLLSLWTVDDETTADLMTDFYGHLHAADDERGISPAAALRQAQLSSLAKHQHPFFWSPFALVGAW